MSRKITDYRNYVSEDGIYTKVSIPKKPNPFVNPFLDTRTLGEIEELRKTHKQ